MAEVRLKWPKNLVIVRHGESEQNRAHEMLEKELIEDELVRLSQVRDADIRLTEKGIWQAMETGKYLSASEPFEACFSSPYERTMETARRMTSQFPYDIEIIPDIRIREKEFGRLHGLSRREISEKFPEEERFRRMEGKFYYRLLGGENYPDVAMRVHAFMDKLSRDYGGKNVLVTTHQVPYKMFRFWYQRLDERGVLSLEEAPNCAIQRYSLDTSKKPEGRLVLVDFNKVVYQCL